MNLNDVAKRARVSPATVSRVLNNTAGVKSSTRQRVMKVVGELNYQPNLHARTLARGTNRTIGMIVSNLGNQYFFDIFRTVDQAAQRAGFEVLLVNTDYSPEHLMTNIDLMTGYRVAGLAVIVSEMDAALVEKLCEIKVPVVISGGVVPDSRLTNIRVNCRKGMERLLEYLQGLGHRRTAFIGHHSQLESIDERRRAFLETAERRSPHIETVVFTDSDSMTGGQQAVRDLLASGFDPTAIICVNDVMAIGVLKELRDQGVRVPGDISVTGFDNIGLTEFVSPSLTTVHIPRERIGRLVFENLVRDREHQPAPRDIVIDTDLVLRESTGPVKQGARPR